MQIYPVIPIRDMVIFPGVITPLFTSRLRSIKAIEYANSTEHYVIADAQKIASMDEPGPNDLYTTGTLCKILQTVRLPDGSVKIMLEGNVRCRILRFIANDNFIDAEIERLTSTNSLPANITEAMRRSAALEFEKYVHLNPKIPEEVASATADLVNPDIFADIAASHSDLKLTDKQELLATPDVSERLRKLLAKLMAENDILSIEKEINEKVRSEIDKSQRQYFLREQLKAIQEELGEDSPTSEADELRQKTKDAKMPQETEDKAMREIDRFSKMAALSPEATVARTYVEWLIDLPWQKSSDDHIDLKEAKKILEEDHYGLEEVKERIIEFLAVKKLAANEMRAQVLCFVGPPGVGKTSLGRTIARTMGRKFVNMSLGGMRDEAEIRGHRRTYIGALPGRIIQKIKQAGTNNPVLLMDEIDKVGTDFRGDPASALLEVLDPEQNCTFTDNFLEVPFDLSKVMFITTANDTSTIPRPLLDRMEIISLPGYVAEEKVKIAEKHLLPRIYKEHGLKNSEISIPANTVKNIIAQYTMEAGVRGLDRQLSKIVRKVAAQIVELSDAKRKKNVITDKLMHEMLGAPKLHKTRLPKENPIGTAIGLAWTEAGGEVILIESAFMDGTGRVTFTGNLGNIMQESAETALAYLRSNAKELKLNDFKWQKKDIHIHVPEGAVPKDGPSAGITLALSLCSVLTGRRIDVGYAMTGEMTLHGNILPIGGIREKILAAKRLGINKLIIPADNKDDVVELKKWITDGMELNYVSSITEVFKLALKAKGKK
jgi:ATP-dependent Lon protease